MDVTTGMALMAGTMVLFGALAWWADKRWPAGAPERIGTDHTHKPDKDNLEKAVLDVLEMCGVFANDSQVSRGPVEKIWGARSGLSVEIAPAVARNVPPERDALVGGLPGWLD